MKKLFLVIIYSILYSCIEKEPEIKDKLPEINISTAYPLNNTEIDITGNLLSEELKNEVEYGIVWSQKNNPTINDQKKIINSINRGTRFSTRISDLKQGDKLYFKAFVKNKEGLINYSNEIEVKVEFRKEWRRLGDVPIEEGQFTGVAAKLDGVQLTFLRLNQNNEWEQFKHYNGLWYDPFYTWQKEKFGFPQVSPRQEPLFFNLNLSKENTSPTAFMGGGYTISPTAANQKNYLKDFYWVYGPQNYLQPLPFADGPIAHFSLNRNEYLLEETNPDNFWSYFSIEDFIPKKSFPKIGNNYDFLGVATSTKGYILAQNKNEKEVQIFEYEPIGDSWTKKANFPGQGRLEGTAFTYKNKIYYGLGRTTSPIKGLSDIWEYNPIIDTWQYFGNYPGGGNIKVVAADLGDYAVLFCGYQVRASNVGAEKYFNINDTWMFMPDK
jgi:hypothetical protein